jgi:hypothetical protein
VLRWSGQLAGAAWAGSGTTVSVVSGGCSGLLRAAMRGAGAAVVVGAGSVLASAQGRWTDPQNFVDFAIPDARSRIVETGDALACGVMSVFFGLGGCEPENVTLLLDTSPASLCTPEGLAGKVLFYPVDFWSAVQSPDAGAKAAARSEYACVDWASKRFDADNVGHINARVAFLVARGARGAMWGVAPFDSGGLMLTDDLYEDRSAEGAGTLYLECAVPLAVSQRAALAGASSCELELVCQDLPFAVMFKSAVYTAVFRYGLGLLFSALAAYGVYLAAVMGRREEGRREKLFVLLNNIVSCGALGVWAFFISGWFSQPTLTSEVRDGYILAFFAEVMCTIAIVTIRWHNTLEAISYGVKRSYRVEHIAVALSYTGAVVFELSIIFKVVRIADVQVAVSGIYLLWTAAATAFYLRVAMRFYKRLNELSKFVSTGGRGQEPLVRQIKAILRDVVRTGAVLGATCVSIALCALPQLVQASGWPLIWLFFFACRWMLSFCAMQIASPAAHRVRPADARTPPRSLLSATASTLSRSLSRKTLPDEQGAKPARSSPIGASLARAATRPMLQSSSQQSSSHEPSAG